MLRIQIQDQKSQLYKNIDINYRIAFDGLRIQDKISVSDHVRDCSTHISKSSRVKNHSLMVNFTCPISTLLNFAIMA